MIKLGIIRHENTHIHENIVLRQQKHATHATYLFRHQPNHTTHTHPHTHEHEHQFSEEDEHEN